MPLLSILERDSGRAGICAPPVWMPVPVWVPEAVDGIVPNTEFVLWPVLKLMFSVWLDFPG
jgi:hypothetical protein